MEYLELLISAWMILCYQLRVTLQILIWILVTLPIPTRVKVSKIWWKTLEKHLLTKPNRNQSQINWLSNHENVFKIFLNLWSHHLKWWTPTFQKRKILSYLHKRCYQMIHPSFKLPQSRNLPRLWKTILGLCKIRFKI